VSIMRACRSMLFIFIFLSYDIFSTGHMCNMYEDGCDLDLFLPDLT
jgi:hypothetical protein